MKKPLKNKDLFLIAHGASTLVSYKMPGNLTFAIVSARKLIKEALDNYQDARKQLAETRCILDENKKPVFEFQKDAAGNELKDHPQKYKFENPEIEAEAIAELKKIDEKEIDINVFDIPKSVVESLQNITPEQMEAISSLVNII